MEMIFYYCFFVLLLLPLLYYVLHFLYKFIFKRHRRLPSVGKVPVPISTDVSSSKRAGWLNDEVINSYLDLIIKRSQQDGKLPKVYAFNSFFYLKLYQEGYSGVKRWTRKMDIFGYHLLLIPIHLGNHWCMTIVDFDRKRIDYYDSLLGDNQECLEIISEYLINESDKKQLQFDMGDWALTCRKDIPCQRNSSDCGVFACLFAECASRDAPFSFNYKDIPCFRKRIAAEIDKKQLTQ